MEELTAEILEIDDHHQTFEPRPKRNNSINYPRLQGTLKSDFRNYSIRISHVYSSFYSQRRELFFKKSRLSKL